MGGSVLQFSSFSALNKPSLGKPFLPMKEIGYRPSVSSIRADGNSGKPRNSKSFDDRSSRDKREEMLSLFKRIQSLISKDTTTDSKKSNSKVDEDEDESLIEILRRSTTQGKGKTQDEKGYGSLALQKDSPKKDEERPESLLTTGLKPSTSSTKRSPIPTLSNPKGEIEPKNELLPARDDEKSEQANKFEEMKVAELKEVAKANGIKGYSRLNKSELVELLIRSLNTTSQ